MWGDGFLRKGGFAFSISCVRTVRAHTVCSCRTNGFGDGRLRLFCFFDVCPPISDRVCANSRTLDIGKDEAALSQESCWLAEALWRRWCEKIGVFSLFVLLRESGGMEGL